MENEEIKPHLNDDDTVIVVTMSKEDYNIMKELIKDKKSMSYLKSKLVMFSLTLSGVLVAWATIGDKIISLFKKAIS